MPFSPKHLRFKHSFGRVYGNRKPGWEAIYPLPLLTAWGGLSRGSCLNLPTAPPHTILLINKRQLIKYTDTNTVNEAEIIPEQ